MVSMFAIRSWLLSRLEQSLTREKNLLRCFHHWNSVLLLLFFRGPLKYLSESLGTSEEYESKNSASAPEYWSVAGDDWSSFWIGLGGHFPTPITCSIDLLRFWSQLRSENCLRAIARQMILKPSYFTSYSRGLGIRSHFRWFDKPSSKFAEYFGIGYVDFACGRYSSRIALYHCGIRVGIEESLYANFLIHFF